MYSSENGTRRRPSNTPVVPLPNVGEGGPVYPGNMEGGTPVVPLPNPGEGGPVYPGNGEDNTPVVPLPNPGEGGPVYPGTDENGPVVGGPIIGWPGGVIIAPSLPNLPCFFCSTNNTRYARVRFLNAAYGYAPFRVFINNRFDVNNLSYTALSPYGRVSDGFHTITVTGMDGYIYIQKSLPFKAGDPYTVAIINTPGGLDLLQINDRPCEKSGNMSCFRACNLVLNSNPLDLLLYDGRVVYSDLRFKEVGVFKRIRPGDYQFYVAETDLAPQPREEDIETIGSDLITFSLPEALVSYMLEVRPNKMYTMFLLSLDGTSTGIQVMTVEDNL